MLVDFEVVSLSGRTKIKLLGIIFLLNLNISANCCHGCADLSFSQVEDPVSTPRGGHQRS